MIIGIDGSRAFIKDRTGTENYSYQILKYLSLIDRKNTYHIFIRPGVNITDKWPDNFRFKTIPFHRLWTQAGLAKETVTGPKLDVLFVPSHTLPIFKKPGLKTVITVHDLGAEYLPKTHQLKQRLYLKMMTNFQIKSATKIIAVSKATRNDLIKKVRMPAEKISVVYEGYNKDLFKPVKKAQLVTALKEFNLKEGEYFLFVGTIQPRKNLTRLITAYAEFLKSQAYSPNKRFGTSIKYQVVRENKNQKPIIHNTHPIPQLVLVGNKGWLAESIYSLPRQLRIEDHVKFLGYVPDDHLPALYSGAKAFLFPSLFEGFGLPILEAMACGCPVLTSNVSSLPEVAGDAAVFVNPYSQEDIVQGIAKIANSQLRNKLVATGLQQVKNFSWEKAARQTLEVLENAAKSS